MWQGSAFQDKHSSRIIEEIPACPIKYLVFEGGGIRGIAYAGVVEELEKAGLLSDIEHVAGSSIGSIAALLIALGSNAAEIEDFLRNLEFEYFLEEEKPWSITPNLITKGKQYLTILTSHSLSSGDRFLALIEKIVELKLGTKDATFAALANRVEDNQTGFKYLSVTGSNISKCRLEIFNHETTPNMPFALAIRISASFPGVFKAKEVVTLEETTIQLRNADDILEEKLFEEIKNIYVDGGLMENLPAFIFADKRYLPEGFCFNDKGVNTSILNIKIDTEDEVRQLLWNNGYAKPINGIADYSKKLFDGMQSRDTEIHEKYATNIIQVDDCGIDTLNFDVTDLERQKLITSGRQATLQWLENHVSEAYQIKVYDNQTDWLNRKSIEEIVQIKNAYQHQLLNLLQSENNEISKNEIKKNYEEKLTWFDNYLQFRLQKLIYPDETAFDFEPHIDLYSLQSRQNWNATIKNNLQIKLLRIDSEITFLESKLNEINERIDQSTNHSYLHNIVFFDLVIYLTKLEERLKWLNSEKIDLLNKLHLKADLNKVIATECCHAERMLLCTKIKAHITCKSLTISQHANLISALDKHLYACKVSYQTEEGVIVSLDLRNKDDLKVYIMACVIYLKFSKSQDVLVKDIEYIYKKIFLSETLPNNLKELGEKLNQLGVPLLLSAYRIEGLIKYFIHLDKKKLKEPVIDLDYIFTALSAAAANKKNPTKPREPQLEDPNDIEMEIIYPTFLSHEYSEKFLMFGRSNTIKEDKLIGTQLPKHNNLK